MGTLGGIACHAIALWSDLHHVGFFTNAWFHMGVESGCLCNVMVLGNNVFWTREMFVSTRTGGTGVAKIGIFHRVRVSALHYRRIIRV